MAKMPTVTMPAARTFCTTVSSTLGSVQPSEGGQPQELLITSGAMAGSGGNANPGRMMAICRDRAVHVFHLRAGDVETKYEGQRTDGTHAVNGTAYMRGHEETFQCSFNSSGSSIVQFIVN